MKASELIKELQKGVAEHGDLDVIVYGGQDTWDHARSVSLRESRVTSDTGGYETFDYPWGAGEYPFSDNDEVRKVLLVDWYG